MHHLGTALSVTRKKRGPKNLGRGLSTGRKQNIKAREKKETRSPAKCGLAQNEESMPRPITQGRETPRTKKKKLDIIGLRGNPRFSLKRSFSHSAGCWWTREPEGSGKKRRGTMKTSTFIGLVPTAGPRFSKKGGKKKWVKTEKPRKRGGRDCGFFQNRGEVMGGIWVGWGGGKKKKKVL